MAYTAPTASQLKAKYPAFAAVPDETVTPYIVDGNRMVDATWTEGDYQTAIMLAACHLMVLSGIGAGAEAQVNAQGLAGFQSIRSGSLSLTRGSTSGTDGVPKDLAGSTYGQQFYYLLKKNRPAVAVANAGGASLSPVGGYPLGNPASLWPYGWP